MTEIERLLDEYIAALPWGNAMAIACGRQRLLERVAYLIAEAEKIGHQRSQAEHVQAAYRASAAQYAAQVAADG